MILLSKKIDVCNKYQYVKTRISVSLKDNKNNIYSKSIVIDDKDSNLNNEESFLLNIANKYNNGDTIK